MTSKHLNQKTVDSLKTDQAREDVWDNTFRVRGIVLGVRVTCHGTKTFVCRYRDSSGKRKRLTLGDARTTSLREAHEKARSLSSQNFLTRLPDVSNETRIPATPPSVVEQAISAGEFITTFRMLCNEYLTRHAVQKKDGGKSDARAIRHDLLPFLGDMEASSVRRRDVIAVLDHIALERGAEVMANRTRALLSKIFNFGIERELVTVSPCVGLPRKRKERPKERFLDDDEIKLLWIALESETLRLATFFKMILLTGQRPGEVSRARWSEFNKDLWTIPKERVKNGRTHCVPISPEMATLLDALRACNSKERLRDDDPESDFVFRAKVKGCLASRAIHESLRRVTKASGLKHFTPHDLRRTCATGLRRSGATRETVSRILNHTNRSVTLIYDRYNELPEMRSALAKWGQWVVQHTAT